MDIATGETIACYYDCSAIVFVHISIPRACHACSFKDMSWPAHLRTDSVRINHLQGAL